MSRRNRIIHVFMQTHLNCTCEKHCIQTGIYIGRYLPKACLTFLHFDFKMCFSLQRRATFPHPNFKKWSEHVVFVHFDFKVCFSLQRRAIFLVSSEQLPPHPPLYRDYFSTHPTHKSLKNTAFRDFPNISRLLIFFLSALLFQLTILSEVRLLNFLRLRNDSIT